MLLSWASFSLSATQALYPLAMGHPINAANIFIVEGYGYDSLVHANYFSLFSTLLCRLFHCFLF